MRFKFSAAARSGHLHLALASVGVAALMVPSAAFAQDAPAEEVAAEEARVEDAIIVTARRGEEGLQDVPVSVQVVTGNTLEKLAITSADEVSKLAPGLTLSNAGASTSVTLRGVTWQPGSGTPATPIYLNEVPFDPANTIVSLYDIGQIEVLRGPQGTSRGAPSISGAVTISTRKPDLNEFGGYVQGLYGEGGHKDLQGAINVPVIKDMLAIRLAANIEEGNASRVNSVNSTIDPKFRERNYRATVLFEPTDTLSFQGMYQRRRTLTRFFTQVAGTGSTGFPGFPGFLPAVPAGYNGPPLTFKDRASVQDFPSINDQHIDLLTLNAGWEVFGHKLSYNFGYQYNRSPIQFNANDLLNIVPGFENFLTVENASGVPKFRTQEIRISSLPDPDRPFEYDFGWFSKKSQGDLRVTQPAYLTGAFGNPATVGPCVRPCTSVPVARYVLDNATNIRIGQVFDSFYGNVRFHLTENTELSGGLAIVRDRVPVSLNIQTFAAAQNIGPLAVLRTSFPPAFQPLVTSCEVFAAFAGNPLISTSPTYPGTCDFNIPNGFRNATQTNNDKYTDALYNFSLSHKFTDDLLVYATTGSSFRTGLPAINNAGLPADLVTPEPETAKSYEFGVKSSLGRRLRVNAAVFQLDYKNQLTTFEGVQYFNTVSGAAANTSLAFFRNIDARVRGAEMEIAANPLDGLSLGANLSYSKIKSRGGLVPANVGACPGAVAVSAANPINFCPSPKGQVLNTQAPFQATVNGSYEVPFTDSFGGYVRFNFNYQGKNPNFGNFRTGTTFKKTGSYAIVDLFAGIAEVDGAWNLGIYAKNVFDKQVELARVKRINEVYTQFMGNPGYDQVRTSLPREVGVTLRYAFGSR